MQSLQDTITEYQPFIVTQILRVLLFVQGYMYHSSLGMMHVSWALYSFCVSDRVFFFTSSFIFLPIYAWEFLVTYGSRVPGIEDEIQFFGNNSIFFVQDLYAPTWEQAISFLTLLLLF